MRIRLIHTLALWLMAAVGVSVLAMAGVMSWNLGQGFTAYLQARDTARLETFTEVVADSVRDVGGVEALRERVVSMPAMLRELARREGVVPGTRPIAAPPGGPPDERRPPPHRGEVGGPPNRPRNAPSPTDAFGDRVALFEPDGQPLPGRPLPLGAQPLIERPVRLQGQIIAWARLRPVDRMPAEEEARFLRSQHLGIVGVSMTMILAALLVAWGLARRWAKPLAAVQDATARIARGELGVRVPPGRSDEIGDVVHNVNLMAEGLQRMEGARRRWIADISHELRTPLAGLRGEVEALVDGVRPLTPAAVLSLREDVLRLGKLVDDLHLLAMSDLHSLPCHFADVDAVPLVQDSLRRFAARADNAGVALDWARPPPLTLPVFWDAARIEQLLGNLLENSLRYTDAPGRVELALWQEGGQVQLTMDDSEPGASSADLARLFEPLYRADAARSRHTGGSGLGLAICEAIALAHGGCIEAGASTLGGLQLTLKLPVLATSTRT